MTKWRQMGVVFVLFGAMTQGWAYNAYYYQPTTLDIQEAQQKAEDHRRRAIIAPAMKCCEFFRW